MLFLSAYLCMHRLQLGQWSAKCPRGSSAREKSRLMTVLMLAWRSIMTMSSLRRQVQLQISSCWKQLRLGKEGNRQNRQRMGFRSCSDGIAFSHCDVLFCFDNLWLWYDHLIYTFGVWFIPLAVYGLDMCRCNSTTYFPNMQWIPKFVSEKRGLFRYWHGALYAYISGISEKPCWLWESISSPVLRQT